MQILLIIFFILFSLLVVVLFIRCIIDIMHQQMNATIIPQQQMIDAIIASEFEDVC
jgi:hypothetical protein